MSENLKEEPHHKQEQFCMTRPAYRRGKNLTAVKVYTVNNESQHLFIYGVPTIKLRSEVKSLCLKYGQILSLRAVTDYKTEIFTECYHVQYDRIQSARIAKRLMDNKNFYGSVLHICYAPEYESVAETRSKLFQRNKDVLMRIGHESTNELNISEQWKRKRPASDFNNKKTTNYDSEEDILQEVDPLLPYKKHKEIHIPSEQETECGSSSSNYEKPDGKQSNLAIVQTDILSDKRVLSLIPTQVTKQESIVKRIVFRNKNPVIL